MPGYIDKDANVAVVAPVSPADLAAFCRTAMRELKPTHGIRPKGVPLSAKGIEEISRGMEINRRFFEEGEK